MTPEEAIRSYVYHPSAEEPEIVIIDNLGEVFPHNPGRFERRLALVFSGLALFAFGFLIGKSLP